MEEEKIFKQLENKGYIKYSTEGEDIIRFSIKGESFKFKEQTFEQIKEQMNKIPHIQCILNNKSETFNSVHGKVYSHKRLLDIIEKSETYDEMAQKIRDTDISYLGYGGDRKTEINGQTVLDIKTKAFPRGGYEAKNVIIFFNEYEGISVYQGPYSDIGHIYISIPHADRNERKELCKKTLQMEEDIEDIFKNL